MPLTLSGYDRGSAIFADVAAFLNFAGFKPIPLLCGAALVISTAVMARSETARVGGSVDCSGVWCEVKDLEIVGEIDAATIEKVKRLFDESYERAVREKKASLSVGQIVSLNSPGGSITAAMAIGRILRRERLLAVVPHSGVCHSACVLIFAGAVQRMNAGKLGIHRPSLEVPRQEVSAGNVNELYQRMLQDIRSYFREMNVAEQLADAMLRIEPDQIRLLSDEQSNAYGLTDTDPIEQETVDLQDAQYWGITSRQEYIRRKALTVEACPGKFGCRTFTRCVIMRL